MRTIKFRVWDVNDKKMILWEEVDIEKSHGDDYWMSGYRESKASTAYDHKHIFMQYTGLKDKKGKEIYEGDIITTDLERPYLIVEYRNGAFMLNCNDGLEDYFDIFFGTSEEPKEVYKYGEIIGNVYENQELIPEVPHA